MSATPTDVWTVATAAPPLAPGEIHVWRAPLGMTPDERERLSAVLDADERRRAARFRFDRHRHRFIARRAALRALVGWYVGTRPEDVRYRFLAHGKPELPAEAGGTHLRFNMSHSDELALVAFGLDAELGVDVERIETRRADHGVARRFFAPREIEALEALPATDWTRGFFDCWTRKEAFIKAIGEGLSHPLDAFEVSVHHDEPALLGIAGQAPDPDAWSMYRIDPDPLYAAAIVVRGRVTQLRCLHLNAACALGQDR